MGCKIKVSSKRNIFNLLLLLLKYKYLRRVKVLYFPYMESNKKLDQVFFALADCKRRQILNLLSEGPITVTDIASHFDSTLATISKSITLLEKANLLYKVKKGRTVYCHMNHDTWLEVATYVSMVAHFWQNRLADLEQYINSMTDNNL
ncbi:metalloregulator ArsR/SmtB family transcription factor [Kaarinaea lacus]